MKLLTLISVLATSMTLVSADAKPTAKDKPKPNPRLQLGPPDRFANHLKARDDKCGPTPMCQASASQEPGAPPACANSFAGCKFDQFPCTNHMTPKWTPAHHCYCILATKQAMDAYCQEGGFKGGRNPWKHYYAVQCYGAANDQICQKECKNQNLGNGRINKANPGGPFKDSKKELAKFKTNAIA
ncbi:hypothetical protein F53441_12417 [Fusarium austroafricanum]|uniref:Extracellular membrane protein CFEM domain-containing protein n=1 Tax=Fusarium austroafricanum TaxID=2364996 RepID=A0A8H4JVS3_9HYPO|nr:hypothetical protein F53441_12417 [Fusarium austroafricanum]